MKYQLLARSLARGTLLSLTVSLVGCVAVWGAAHKVVSADSNGIKIQFDPGSTSSTRTAAIAREHCKSFGKVAEPNNATMPYLGIIEDSYTCVTDAGRKP